ncbi:hypothetical protein [Pseudolactococcus insecticola]|uniref:Uncharacterized protein n=1 Tax=Pseudolactococcus insecticola TaxID=2709158 RepID=A0A6A0B8G2_9LACT|nr:hypothetical protein [Lactococcus insecticola]GFH40943.1 hypothetical protein Hs20B_13410 [Lactococcus insecticola]
MSNYEYYKELLNNSYSEVVEFLLEKYGEAQDDYFREKSYQKFLNGKIKSITKGKISRTGEGLYCHHIDENKFLNIGNTMFIKEYSIPFDSQKRDRLVYCDLIEHCILHVLISVETNGEYGLPGFEVFLKPMVKEWYIDEYIPQLKWQRNCYDKSFLKIQETIELLEDMEEVLEKI